MLAKTYSRQGMRHPLHFSRDTGELNHLAGVHGYVGYPGQC